MSNRPPRSPTRAEMLRQSVTIDTRALIKEEEDGPILAEVIESPTRRIEIYRQASSLIRSKPGSPTR